MACSLVRRGSPFNGTVFWSTMTQRRILCRRVSIHMLRHGRFSTGSGLMAKWKRFRGEAGILFYVGLDADGMPS